MNISPLVPEKYISLETPVKDHRVREYALLLKLDTSLSLPDREAVEVNTALAASMTATLLVGQVQRPLVGLLAEAAPNSRSRSVGMSHRRLPALLFQTLTGIKWPSNVSGSDQVSRTSRSTSCNKVDLEILELSAAVVRR